VTTGDLPVALAPGESREITVFVKLPNAEGGFARTAWLWTDADEAKVQFVIVGQALASR
jgi:hypothetical protein